MTNIDGMRESVIRLGRFIAAKRVRRHPPEAALAR
jgi:hypothetical protein